MGSFAIHLDQTELYVGDTVRGELVVHEAVPNNQVLDIHLETHGSRIAAQKLGTQRLHAGPIEAGARFPFALVIPDEAPFSFQGHAVSLLYRVRAEADVPWALDPSEKSELVVRPRPIALTDRESFPRPDPQAVTYGGGWAVVIWAVVILFALLLFPLIPFLLYAAARSRIREDRLDEAKLELPKRRFALGDWVPVRLRFRVKRPVYVESLTLKWEGYESWTTRSGKTSTTHTHHFVQEERVLLEDTVIALSPRPSKGAEGVYRAGPRRRQEGPIFELATGFRLPADGLPGMEHGVRYRVTATLKLGEHSDLLVSETVLTVGGYLTEEPPRPEEVSYQEASGDLAFIAKGEPTPAGVDARVDVEPLWHWVLLMCAGLGTAALGLGLLDGLGALEGGVTLGVAAALFVAGLGGLVYRTYR